MTAATPRPPSDVTVAVREVLDADQAWSGNPDESGRLTRAIERLRDAYIAATPPEAKRAFSDTAAGGMSQNGPMGDIPAAGLSEELAQAYYEPLGWDMDDLDPDDLRDCMKAMEPVAELVAARVEQARAADHARLRELADEWEAGGPRCAFWGAHTRIRAALDATDTSALDRLLDEARAEAWDEGATAAWYDCQIGSNDSRDACEMRVDNPYRGGDA